MNLLLLCYVRSFCSLLVKLTWCFRASLRTIPLVALSLALIALSSVCPSAKAQANEWTWFGGSSTLGSSGVVLAAYGTLGAPAAGNNPGSRASAATWTDKSGNLWLFSGNVYEQYFNDLWMFKPSTAEWTWMGGSSNRAPSGVYGTLGTPSAESDPGGRHGAVTWTDGSGYFWMFGGYGLDSAGNAGYLNDLWEFNPSTNQWTWMGGSSSIKCTEAIFAVQCGQPGVYGAQGIPATTNIPGSRKDATSWIDSKGNLWLLGGYGYDSNGTLRNLNDLWEFNPATNAWTWESGSSTVNYANGQPGVYGVERTPASGNTPGGRTKAVGWTDTKGNLWLFGGYGTDSGDAIGELDDLWMFDTSKSEWAWMAGGNRFGGYGGLPGAFESWLTPAAGNYPGGRQSSTNWTDSDGNFWLYGGVGVDSAGVSGELNDLWEFNPLTNQWSWMGGNSTFVPRTNGIVGQLAVYGVLQTPNFANSPGGLDSALGWTDKSGNLWLYGGFGFDANGWGGYFNDLWENQPSSASLPITATPSFSMNTGIYAAGQTLTISDATPDATIYYFIVGSTAPLEYTDPITISSTETVDAVAIAPGFAASAIATATYSVQAAATPTFSLTPGTFSTAQTVTLADTTPGATIYYAINGAPTTSSNVYNGPITVSTSEILEAIAVAAGYANSAVATASYTIWPTSALNEWAWMGGLSSGAASQEHGILGTPAKGNIPEARTRASSWTDSNGNFWLFGGNGGYGGLNDLWKFNPSTNEWAWLGGNIATNCAMNTSGIEACSQSQPGVYGTLGAPAPENTPGGRQGASSWVDKSGNFWIFGGYGLDASGTSGLTILNDMWKFNPSTHQWVWMSGSSTVDNNCFTFDVGELACAQSSVYGVLGIPAIGNTPGSREDATTWTDSKGNLWLFGGWSFDVKYQVQYYFDELWEFNPTTNQWAWMGGSSTRDGSACIQNVNYYFWTCGEPGIYGTIVTPSSENIPGGRAGAASWVDSKGNFWLFSGNGFDANGYFGDPEDVWEFNPSAKEWTWMGGNNVIPPCANYNCSPPSIQGTLGTPAAGNIPAGRDHASGWTDSKGNFWLYGGGGPTLASDDLWEFDPSANEWVWMGNSGDQSKLPPTVYGELGTPAPGNGPGWRFGASNWTDSHGNLWLFGGQTPFASTAFDNDLWQYAPSAPTPVSGFAVVDLNDQAFHKVDSFTVQAGTSGTTTINTVVAGGFNGAISLSAVGLPSGVTASFSPGTITGFGTSQVTFTVGLAVTPGDYTVGVNGTSGGVTKATTVSFTVGTAPPANFTLGASASALTVKSGGSGTVMLTVTPEYGFNSAVGFACSGLPAGAACSFSPSTITPSGAAASTMLTISTGSQSAASRSNSRAFLPLTALALGLGLFFKKRNKLQYIVLMTALTGLGIASGCGGAGAGSVGAGGNGGGSGSTPVTSTVRITATAATVVQTTSVSLTVN